MTRSIRRPGNLPAESTAFIGRRQELGEVRARLAGARLVTLVGPGGVGKTRLAVRLAADVSRNFRDGAWFVGLGEVQNPNLVVNALSAGVGLHDLGADRPLDLLEAYVANREMLIVLDNCEHVLEVCAPLASRLVRASPDLKVLATSRTQLSVSEEYVYPVPPLRLPSTADPLEALRQNEAVALFVERADAASGSFELAEGNRAAVSELCRRLDGLPLAIELAAVRTRVLSVDQILERLADRFALLTGGSRAALPRHQTLRTTVDWSYELLDEAERGVFSRLCVFAGGFGLEAVEAICCPDVLPAERVLDVVGSLVEKSLAVKVEQGGRARYRLHETMREYAQARLREQGSEDTTWRRLADYYAAKCARSIEEAQLGLVQWLAWIEDEIDNLRALLKRCQDEADYPTGLGLAGAVGWYWTIRAAAEGVGWLDFFLDRADQIDVATSGQAWFVRGCLGMTQARPERAMAALKQAATAARVTGKGRLLAQILSVDSHVHNMAGDHPGAKELAAESASVANASGDALAQVAGAQAEGFNCFIDRDLDRVKTVYERAARISRQEGDLYSEAHCLLSLGVAHLLESDMEAAKPVLEAGLRIARDIDDRVALHYFMEAFACHASAVERPRTAAHFLGAAETIRQETGGRVNVLLAPLVAESIERCARSLGAERFASEIDVGQHMNIGAALALALAESPAKVGPRTVTHDDVLAKRERDVAGLVAEGLSNKEIGARLFISERTVESHVRSILNKLGFSSRAQIAAWVGSSR